MLTADQLKQQNDKLYNLKTWINTIRYVNMMRAELSRKLFLLVLKELREDLAHQYQRGDLAEHNAKLQLLLQPVPKNIDYKQQQNYIEAMIWLFKPLIDASIISIPNHVFVTQPTSMILHPKVLAAAQEEKIETWGEMYTRLRDSFVDGARAMSSTVSAGFFSLANSSWRVVEQASKHIDPQQLSSRLTQAVTAAKSLRAYNPYLTYGQPEALKHPDDNEKHDPKIGA